MRKVLLLALFCLVVVFAQKVNKKLWWNDTKALLLKSNNFLNHVGKDKIVIVQFIAQFSRDCQALLPEWDKLALMYQGENPKRSDVTVALIDGWTFNSISQSYGVTAFPSIIIFGKGDAQTQTVYKGERKADKMSEFIEQFANGEIPPDEPVQPVSNDAAGDVQAASTGDAQTASTGDAQTASSGDAQTDTAGDANTSPPPTQDQNQNQQQDQQQATQDAQANTDQPNDNAQAAPQINTPPPPQDNSQAAPTQQEPPQQAPPQQVQQVPPQPLEPREVNVVLNTSLLQSQFEELQRHTTALNEALQKSINDNFQRFEGLKAIIETHKADIEKVNHNVMSHNPNFEEMKRTLLNQKNDFQKTIGDHYNQVQELKGTVNEIKSKVSERRIEEPKESSTFSSATVMFVVGGLIGAAVTFVVVGASGNKTNKRKLLID